MRSISLIGPVVLLACAVCGGVKSDPFKYDRSSKPAVIEPLKESDTIQSFKVKFQGYKEVVPGILTLPKSAKGRPPVLLLLHGMGGNKSQMDSFALLGAQLGYASFALDAPLHGERSKPGKLIIDADLQKTHDNWVEAIIDYRIAIDFLETRKDIDAKRIVLVGISMGGMMGSVIAGAEKRVDAAALIIAGGDYMKLASESKHPIIPLLKRSIDVAGKEKTESMLRDVDGIYWAEKITPRPVLFVNGLDDPIMPKACAQALIVATKQPKTIIWDPVGHTIAPGTIPKIMDWIKANTPQ